MRNAISKAASRDGLPQHIRDDIRDVGIRNSHLLSIAPTGTIALAFADNASNGIEPAFSWVYSRKKRMPDNSIKQYQVEDRAYRLYRQMGGDVTSLPEFFVSAMDMSADEHLQMLVVVQPFIDSSISKTVNVPKDHPFEAFKGLYTKAWRAGLKGLATYRPNAVTGAVLSLDDPTATPLFASAEDDPLRKQFESRPEGELEGSTSKVEYWTNEGKKSVYLTVNFMRVRGMVAGRSVQIERPVEFFMPAGQRDEGSAVDRLQHAPAVAGCPLRRVDREGLGQHARSGVGPGSRAVWLRPQGRRCESPTLARLRSRRAGLRAAADPGQAGLPRYRGHPGAGTRDVGPPGAPTGTVWRRAGAGDRQQACSDTRQRGRVARKEVSRLRRPCPSTRRRLRPLCQLRSPGQLRLNTRHRTQAAFRDFTSRPAPLNPNSRSQHEC
jgi:hypothetical protein